MMNCWMKAKTTIDEQPRTMTIESAAPLISRNGGDDFL